VTRNRSDFARRAAALEAKNSLVGLLRQTIGSSTQAISIARRPAENPLDELAGALCEYAIALRNLGLTLDDAMAELVQVISAPFAYRQRQPLIALAGACSSVVYGIPATASTDAPRHAS
jgi:hypothetical protein